MVFLDTQYHFAETLWRGSRARALRPQPPAVEPLIEADDSGSPTPTPAEMQVEPLARALQGKAAWLTGLRRDEASTRANAPVVGWDIGRGIVKVNPLATWSHDDIDGYVADRGLPQHPLRDKYMRRSGAGRARCPSPAATTCAPAGGPAPASWSAGLHGWTPSRLINRGGSADRFAMRRSRFPRDQRARRRARGGVHGARRRSWVDPMGGLHDPRLDVEREGAGSRGRARSDAWVGGRTPREEILEYHPLTHMAYTVVSALAHDYRADVNLYPDAGGTLIRWRGLFTPFVPDRHAPTAVLRQVMTIPRAKQPQRPSAPC